ncbi:MAG: serine/threonine-protein kinase [Myxococcota bacterium]
MEGDRRELQFLRTLGVGGFGAVYLANLHGRDRFVRRVAVKIMREGLDATPDLVARQKDEARLLGLLAHEGIVQVLDLAEVEGRPAVVMEYVEGVDLSDVIKAIAPQRFPVRAALEVVASVASALDAAYNSVSALTGQPLRVIHRDIKPANILLTSSGRVKVLDFGVAKADFARDGQTTNNLFGTPRFMAPEQWLGDAYGAPVDVYALGVTLFDLVADRPWERPPLALNTFQSKVSEQLNAQTDVPEPVLALIEAMCAYDPADRPTPAEVREFAEHALSDAPGESLPRLARATVPGLVEAKNQRTANEPVPSPVTLGTAPYPALDPGADSGASLVQRTPASTRVPKAVWAALAAGVGLMVLLSVGLAAAAWTWSAPGPAAAVEDAASPPDAALTEPAAAPDAVAEAPDATAGHAASAAVEAPAAPDAPPAADVPPPASAATPPEPRRPTSRAPTRSATPAPATATSAATTPASTTPTAPAADAAPAPRYPLSVVSIPASAEVWVDGKQVGETPLPTHMVAAGTHSVWLVLEGKRSETTSVTVGASATPKVRYDFTKNEWRSVK